MDQGGKKKKEKKHKLPVPGIKKESMLQSYRHIKNNF